MIPTSPSQKGCKLQDLDSHRYPLALAPTPANIRTFVFNQHGVARRFTELDPTEPVSESVVAAAADPQPQNSELADQAVRKRPVSPSSQQSRLDGSKRRLTEIPLSETPLASSSSASTTTTTTTTTTTSSAAHYGIASLLNPIFRGPASATPTPPALSVLPASSTSSKSTTSEPSTSGSCANVSSVERPSSSNSPSISTTTNATIPSITPGAPQTATDSLETPLSPASSPRNPDFDDQERLPLISPSETAGKDSADADSSALALFGDTAMEKIIISNLTTPSVIPPQLTSTHDIYNVINNFSVMPQQIKKHVLFKLLQSCDRTTICSMLDVMSYSLRQDILSRLPTELIPTILGYLDVRSLCAACTVSHTWRDMVDSSKNTWKALLERDELGTDIKEVVRAQNERWDYLSWGISPDASPTQKAIHAAKHKSLSTLERPINIYKAIYRRKVLIEKNWMDPNSRPYHLSINGNPNDVVTCLQFDEEKIIIGSDDHTITIYDTTTGAMRAKLKGHDNGVWALKYVGNTLVSGSTDRTVRVWDIKNKRCTHVFQDHDSTVRCLDIMMPQKIGVDAHRNPIMAPKKPLIVTGSRDNTIKVWELPEADPNTVYPQHAVPATGNDYLIHTMTGHSDSVRAISGYGELVVSGSYDNNVRVWVVETGECKWVLRGHEQRVYSVVIDPKRNRCISGSMDWLVKLWSLETGAMLYSLQGHTSLVGLVDLNRSTIVSAAADCTLCVWNPDNGSLLHMLKGHKGVISSFQHDELKVVSGSERTLKLWNINTGELVRDLLENMDRIWQVRFDNRRCVAVVMHDHLTTVEVLDFDYDPYAPRQPTDREERYKVFHNGERVEELHEPDVEMEQPEDANVDEAPAAPRPQAHQTRQRQHQQQEPNQRQLQLRYQELQREQQQQHEQQYFNRVGQIHRWPAPVPNEASSAPRTTYSLNGGTILRNEEEE